MRKRGQNTKDKHGLAGTPEHHVWGGIIGRCYTPSNSSYHKYGGRGITVCERWRDSFSAFIADMGPRPSPEHSIERIDFNGNYEPSNCRWATQQEQSINRRNNHRHTRNGVTKTVTEWAREIGIPEDRVWSRLKDGWDVERALTTPKMSCWKHGRYAKVMAPPLPLVTRKDAQ